MADPLAEMAREWLLGSVRIGLDWLADDTHASLTALLERVASDSARPLVEALREARTNNARLIRGADGGASLYVFIGEPGRWAHLSADDEELSAAPVGSVNYQEINKVSEVAAWLRAALAAHEEQERKHGCANRGNCTGSNEPQAPGAADLALMRGEPRAEPDDQGHGPVRTPCLCPGCPATVPLCWVTSMCRLCAGEDCEHGEPQAKAPLPLGHEFEQGWQNKCSWFGETPREYCGQPEAAHKPR